MTSHGPLSASLRMKALPPLPSSSTEIPENVEESETVTFLTEGESRPAKSIWFTDVADLFILLCSLLLTTISIIFVAFVPRLSPLQATHKIIHLETTLSSLQRVISSLSVTITSAVVMVAGKRYVFFKLARRGLRSRRVALYSNPSIGALVSYLVLHGAELPLLGLSAVWVLALVTSLTVDKSWVWRLSLPPAFFETERVSGPLNAEQTTPFSSCLLLTQAAMVLSNIMQLSACPRPSVKNIGLVNITGANTTADYSSAIVYYPPPPGLIPNLGHSFPTTLNGFDFSMESLSSVPPTAQSLNCSTLNLWFGGSDNQTLSIIASESPSNGTVHDITGVFRFNATAIIMGGTLSSNSTYFEFSRNGTSWPNVMSNDSRWAQDIVNLVCITPMIGPIAPIGSCRQSSLIVFAANLNNKPLLNGDTFYSALSMALGAYSSVIYGTNSSDPDSDLVQEMVLQYGFYILPLHIVVSLIMLVVTVKLRLASPLGPDFINSTRLLLDPLRKPSLFNVSLETTLDALEDPYMAISATGSELLITERKVVGDRKGWFSLGNFKSKSDEASA